MTMNGTANSSANGTAKRDAAEKPPPEGANSDEDYRMMVTDAKRLLAVKYGAAPMTPSDVVMAMQGWNKVLAFKTAFSEALLLKWRYLVHPDSQSPESSKRWTAIGKVERNQDMLASCLGPRLEDAEALIMGLLDGVFRSFCPHSQTVLREAYRATQDDVTIHRKEGENMTLECETTDDYTRLFARCGIEPHCWICFCEAFLWCMESHMPYAQDDDKEDLEKGFESAYRKAIRIAANRAIDGYVTLRSSLEQDIFQIGVPRFWARLDHATKAGFGEVFYKTLLSQNQQLLDFFSRTDMDSLAIHFMATLDLLVKSIREIGTSGHFRNALDMLAEVHRQTGIPTFSYALVGGHLLDCLKGSLEAEEETTKDELFPATAKQLTRAFAVLYTEVMSIVYYPMLLEEKKIAKAQEFYEHVQIELQWSDRELQRRMLEVGHEISASGTYTQTKAEIETGARLAWRNSTKCIGRISWNTLKVRDCRHVTEPDEIFKQVNEHMRIATAGTNIQSVMTVFKPQSAKEPLGTRFWSSQVVRYAAYKLLDGTIEGDPANLGLTSYLLEHDLWTPPAPTTPFDVLPLVLKVPGRKKPSVYTIPSEFVFMVDIDHPTKPEVKELGYKWSIVPAITNFRMNLGGIVYANMPFNGWFMSTEIVRNLLERYKVGPAIAKACGVDPESPMCQQIVSLILEEAILQSFQKAGFTIVDPHSVGKSFCTHVRREREEFGRECPGQWSWIGGLVGPTNDTWHLEMRDFLVNPQYEYCMEGMKFFSSFIHAGETKSIADETASTSAKSFQISVMTSKSLPKPFIVYGSETGSAEAVARRLKRDLYLLKPTVMSLNQFAKEIKEVEKRKVSHIICVSSTFGKGSPPSNAVAFFDKVIPSSAFAGTKYAVLALGSTLYPDFCKAGTQLDRKMAKCGSTKMVPVKKVDDAARGDGVVQDWVGLIKRLVLPAHLEEEIIATRELTSGMPPVHVLEWSGKAEMKSANTPDAGSSLCLLNVELAEDTAKAGRSIRKIKFELPKGSSYETGDHLCVYPLNSKGVVNRFLACFTHELNTRALQHNDFPYPKDSSAEMMLEWQSQQLFDIVCIENGLRDSADVFFDTPICLHSLLMRKVDLTLSAKNVMDLLTIMKKNMDAVTESLDNNLDAFDAIMGTDTVQRFYTLTAEILDESADKITVAIDSFIAQYPTVVVFLEEFRELFLADFLKQVTGSESVKPIMALAEVLVVLPRLQPRYYSISSSSNDGKPNEVAITVGVLKTTTSRGVLIEGVCSHYLANLGGGIDRATISVSKSSFRLPNDPAAPLVLVGTGTGISPLMGFLEDKALQWKNSKEKAGPTHLFFGCRTEHDFIYKNTITDYRDKKMIDLHLALSRSETEPKKYVQHRIADMGKQACDLLQRKDTHYYVCGDARMADECYEACVEVLRKHAVISRVAAVQHIRQMAFEGRWQTDVWGIVSHFEDAKKSIEKKKRQRAKLWLAKLASGTDANE